MTRKFKVRSENCENNIFTDDYVHLYFENEIPSLLDTYC